MVEYLAIVHIWVESDEGVYKVRGVVGEALKKLNEPAITAFEIDDILTLED
jgi:hypothetical protein